MMDKEIIPHSRPSLSDSDIEAVASAIKSGQLSQGPKVAEFERKSADFIGKKEAASDQFSWMLGSVLEWTTGSRTWLRYRMVLL